MSDIRYRLSESISWQQVDSEVVVLDLAQSKYVALNGAATVLWSDLAAAESDGVSGADLATRLAEKFDLSTEQARADADSFLNDALDRGLLRPVGA